MNLSTCQIKDLNMDFGIYPRVMVDQENLTRLREAIAFGIKLPPVIACIKSKKVIDGFHRLTVYRELHGDGHEVQVEWRAYRDDKERFADAWKANTTHGKQLADEDKRRCIRLASKFRIESSNVRHLAAMTDASFAMLVRKKAASMRHRQLERIASPPNRAAIIHQQIRRFGTSPKTDPSDASILANQLLIQIDNPLSAKNGRLVAVLRRLQGVIERILSACAD